jgi:hypothetical protein
MNGRRIDLMAFVPQKKVYLANIGSRLGPPWTVADLTGPTVGADFVRIELRLAMIVRG